MIDVIQIFKSEERFKKGDYETGRLLNQWEDSLLSGNGYLKGRTLYLPDTGREESAIEKAKTVIILDLKGFDPFASALALKTTRPPRWHMDTKKKHMLYVRDEIICYYNLAASMDFEIFRIEKKQPDSFNLYLNYTGNRFAIGIPERDDHKIAGLKPGKAVRYRLNGKSDFTMSGRKQRTFAEYDYIIEYPGQADKIVFKDPDKIKMSKTPNKEYKLVDERKILK